MIKKMLYSIKTFLFIFLLWSAVFSQNTVSYYNATLYIAYDKMPDELLIDGEKVDITAKNVFGVEAGEHLIEARLSCHYPIKLTVTAKEGYTKPVSLKFRHITTPEYKNFAKTAAMNYALNSLSIIPSFFYEGGMTTLLPISLMGLAGTLSWHLKEKSRFDICDKKYNGIEYSRKSFGIFLGITGRIAPEFSSEISEKFEETYLTPVPVGIKRFLKKRVIVVPNDNVLSHYGISLGVQKRIYKDFYLTLNADLYPEFIVRTEFYDENSESADFDTPRETVDKQYFFYTIGLDAEYTFYKAANNSWNFLIGGFGSKSVSEDLTYVVMHPLMDYFEKNPPETYVSYRYDSYGVNAGISTTFLFSKTFNFKMIYRAGYMHKLMLNGQETSTVLMNISANILFNL